MKELIKIQQELKAPKNQRNAFGKYNYRSCEDILEAVKPLAHKESCVVTLSDSIVEVGGRVYVEALATITNSDGNSQVTSAYAREPLAQKGMNEAQITGSASSYARKYALNGLFAIDDTKDADTEPPIKEEKPEPKKEKQELKEDVLNKVLKGNSIEGLRALLNNYKVTDIQSKAIIIRGKELTKLAEA